MLAAALLALSVPFVYYAKTANLDVPYLFWFALSLLFFLRALRRARTADFALFGLAAAAAVATKDQALALYVLTVPVLAWEVYARRRAAGERGLRALADARLAALVVTGADGVRPPGRHRRQPPGVGGARAADRRTREHRLPHVRPGPRGPRGARCGRRRAISCS